MFETTTHENGAVTILAVRGEVDMKDAPRLWGLIEAIVDRRRALKVQLEKVTYIDSSGIATLIRGLKYAQKNNVDYALLAPSKRVMAVLELAQLGRLFSIESGE